MAEIRQHLRAERADIHLPRIHAQAAHQRPGAGFRALRGREARHGHADDVLSRQAQPIHGARRHDQGLGRIQPTGDADDQLLQPRRPQPGEQAGHLNIPGLETILVQPRGGIWHIGEARDQPAQRQFVSRRVEGEFNRAKGGRRSHGTVPKRPHSPAFLRQTLDINIHAQHLRAIGEAAALAQFLAIFKGLQMAIPGQIGGGFALPGGGVKIGGDGAAGLRIAQHPPVLALGHRDGRA